MIFNVPHKRFISLLNQVNILHGSHHGTIIVPCSHVDFSLVGIKPDFGKFLE